MISQPTPQRRSLFGMFFVCVLFADCFASRHYFAFRNYVEVIVSLLENGYGCANQFIPLISAQSLICCVNIYSC